MRTIGYIYYLFTIIFLVLGCASTGFLMAKPEVTLFGEPYAPKDNVATIDVFMTNKPNQEYLEIAQITCKDTSDKWNLDQIIKKAREVGADGVIIIGKAGSYGVDIPMGNSSSYVVNEEYGMSAIAIKYK